MACGERPFDQRVPNGKTPAVLEGIVRFHRGSGPNADACHCCDGPHIYGYRVEVEPFPVPATGLEGCHTNQWLDGWLSSHRRDGIEGKRVRLSIEVIEDDPA